MPLPALAWGPGHPALVTFDGLEVLAYDSETEAPRWRVALRRPVSGVVLADATGLDVGDAGAPFRTPSAIGAVVAVDDEGRLHAIDAASGRLLGEVEPAGAPRAIAAAANGSVLAIATADAVVVFRKAARAEIALKATAIAFSADGSTLAVGAKDGTVKMFDVGAAERDARLPETLSIAGTETVVDLVQHPSGAWVIAVPSGLVVVDRPGQGRRLDKIRTGPKRMAFDAGGDRLAVQLTDRQVLVYEWPALSVLTRIELTDRPVRGLAFGADRWLGVALDHGDGNKIDVVSGAVHRTDTHAGRTHRSWTLLVEGKKDRLTEKEAEDVRRMKTPAAPTTPAFGGRIGIGAMITFALVGLRVCARASSSSSSYPYSSSGYAPAPLAQCDRACATERVRTLQKDCAAAHDACEERADRALAALAAGDCAAATAALDHVASTPHGSPSSAPLLDVHELLAELGVREACRDGSIRPKRVPHPRLVRLAGPEADPAIEDIPELRTDDGERPRAVWAATDGTVLVGASVPGSTTRVIHRRTASGAWQIVHQQSSAHGDDDMTFFGRGPSDVYATIGGALLHFDGASWSNVATPASPITWGAANGSDVFAVAGGDASPALLRRQGAGWARERTGDLRVVEVRSGGASVWALGRIDGESAIAQRAPGGTWTVKKAGVEAGSAEPLGLWVSPSGDPFVLTDAAVLRGKGDRWTADDLEVAASIKVMWGRSSADVYAATSARLFHFDGKAWAPTAYAGEAEAIAGTAKEVLVVRADE